MSNQFPSESMQIVQEQNKANIVPNLAFISCIEAGYLEAQSLLLYESIRYYGGRFKQCPVYAISPRVGHNISSTTKRRLEQLSIEYLDLELNRDFADYPYGNKTFACAYIEKNRQHNFLVFLDSDTLFFREPNQLELADKYDVAVRPVSWKTICTSSSTDDPYDSYWRLLCKHCHVDYDSIPLITTFLQRAVIKACYNSGLVAVRASRGIFSQWQDHFVSSLRQGLEPKKGNCWGSDQSTLSTAIWGTTERVQILPPSYNYPIRSLNQQPSCLKLNNYQNLIHIHYHQMFNDKNLSTNPLFQPDFKLDAELKTWLLTKLPLDKTDN